MAPDCTVLDEVGRDRGGGVWTVDGVLGPHKIAVRMTVLGYVEIGTGQPALIIVSALPPLPSLVAWLKQTGRVQCILIPNCSHTSFATAMKEAFPQAQLVGPSGLAAKAQTAALAASCDALIASTDRLPKWWPSSVQVVKVQGIPRLDELALFHRPSRTLLLTDLAVHHTAAPAGLLQRAVAALTGGPPELALIPSVRALVEDPQAAKDSLDKVMKWDVQRVALAHGSWVETDAKAALAAGTVAAVSALQRRSSGEGDGGGARVAVAAAVAVALAGVGAGLLALLHSRARPRT